MRSRDLGIAPLFEGLITKQWSGSSSICRTSESHAVVHHVAVVVNISCLNREGLYLSIYCKYSITDLGYLDLILLHMN